MVREDGTAKRLRSDSATVQLRLFQELVEQGPECAERVVEQLREILDSFVGQLDAVRQEGRAESPPTAQASSAA